MLIPTLQTTAEGGFLTLHIFFFYMRNWTFNVVFLKTNFVINRNQVSYAH